MIFPYWLRYTRLVESEREAGPRVNDQGETIFYVFTGEAWDS